MSGKTGLAILCVSTAALLGPISIAAADSGDGRRSCNLGEICFSKDYPASSWQKHFWYAGDHQGYYWFNVSTGASGTAVRNSASAIKNRDTVCRVKVVNDRNVLPDGVEIYSPNDTTWRYLSSVNDANDRHERC